MFSSQLDTAMISLLLCETFQGNKPDTIESTKEFTSRGKDKLMQELDATKQQLFDLQKQHQELEANSKADIKVLVKEVKHLRSSQAELKQQLNQSLKEKSEAEVVYQFSIRIFIIM